MPRVLRITNRLNIGGPTYNVALLSKHLAPKYETMLVAGMKDESEASSEFIVQKMGLKPTYVSNMFRSISLAKDWKAYQEIKQLIRQFKPDIVHTHAAKPGTLGRLAAWECGVPVIVHTFHGHVFHSYFSPLKTRIFLMIERALARISSRIIAISPKQKEELGDIYKIAATDKIATVPLGFDLNRFREDQVNKRIEFRQKHRITDDEVAIGIIGRLVPVKNHDLFLQAIQAVKAKTNKKIRAFIVGDGEERPRLEQLTKDLGIDMVGHEEMMTKKATVTFTSWIKNVDEVYAGLDIVALSSLNEGTPVSLIEAQAANKPIVTTNVGGVGDVTIPNKTALLSPSKDLEAFSENLLKLVDSQALRFEMGASGNDFVEEKYSYKRLTRDMDHLYESLLWEKVGSKQATPKSTSAPAPISTYVPTPLTTTATAATVYYTAAGAAPRASSRSSRVFYK